MRSRSDRPSPVKSPAVIFVLASEKFPGQNEIRYGVAAMLLFRLPGKTNNPYPLL
jgi:hypothetical protein